MSPHTVLIVMPSLSRGGAERHGAWMAIAINKSRWRAHVLAFGDGPLEDELRAAGVTVHVEKLPGGFQSVKTSANAIRRTIDEIRPALITGHHIRVELAIRIALRRRPLPYLAWKHTYGNVGRRGLRERLFETLTGRSVTAYGAVCHTQVRYLTDELRLRPEKIVVVCNSVPTSHAMNANMPQGHPVVLMAAAMRADKDHASVLRAWPTVLAEWPEARLRMAGDGPCRIRLQSLAVELGIADRVEFLGLRLDVDQLLVESHLMVLASYAVECFPYAVLEAMAAGRGVVSTDVAGLPEMIDDGVTGRLVPPRDSRALAAGLLHGLADALSDTPRWGKGGAIRLRSVFPFDRWAERIADVFDAVAASEPMMAPKRMTLSRKLSRRMI